MAVWAVAALLLAAATRWARVERLTAALVLTLATDVVLYVATGVSLAITRQIPARDALASGTGVVRLAVDADVPSVRADAAQLERAFANLLENARRYSNGLPVSVHARRSGSRLDLGPAT